MKGWHYHFEHLLWIVRLRRLSYFVHRKNEPLFRFHDVRLDTSNQETKGDS